MIYKRKDFLDFTPKSPFFFVTNFQETSNLYSLENLAKLIALVEEV